MRTITNRSDNTITISTECRSTPTLNDWFDIWLETYKKGRIKATSIDTYTALYNRHIRAGLGQKRINDLFPLHIQQLYNEFLDHGYSAKYLNTLHSLMNNLFSKAYINGLIPSNPCSYADRPAPSSQPRRVLSPKEQQAVVTKLKDERFRRIEPVITTLLGTGLRIGELLGLKWSDLITDHTSDESTPSLSSTPSLLRVQRTLVRVKNGDAPGSHYLLQTPKTKSSIRIIPLQSSVTAALNRQRILLNQYSKKPGWSPLPGFEDLIFPGKKGQPQWRSTIVKCIETVIKSINEDEITYATLDNRQPEIIDRILPHTFRHTFATRCLETGIPPKIVQGWLGHASINITLDLYTHVSENLSCSYMKVLEQSYNCI